MITCSNCGRQNEAHYPYCLSCGANLRPTTPQPNQGRYPITKSGKTGRFFAGASGAVLMLMSLPCVVSATIDLVQKGMDSGAAIALIFFAGLSMIATMLMVYALKKPKEAPFTMDRNLEQLILGVAKAERGRLTTAELALQTNLSIAESEQALKALLDQRVADFELMPDGSTVYLFPAFMKAHDATHHRHQSDMAAFDQQLQDNQTTFDFQGQDGQTNQMNAPLHQQHFTNKK